MTSVSPAPQSAAAAVLAKISAVAPPLPPPFAAAPPPEPELARFGAALEDLPTTGPRHRLMRPATPNGRRTGDAHPVCTHAVLRDSERCTSWTAWRDAFGAYFGSTPDASEQYVTDDRFDATRTRFTGRPSFYGPYLETLHMADGTTATFSALGRESLRAAVESGGCDWFAEWRAAAVAPSQTLTMMGARMHALNDLAARFAGAVQETAVRIASQHALPASRRSFAPLGDGFDDTYLVGGVAFVVATSPAFAQFFGSSAAAAKAAVNEAEAVRTMLGVPNVTELVPPLVAIVRRGGTVVFASATMPIDDAQLVHGLDPRRGVDATQVSGAAVAFEFGEYAPLQAHVIPSSNSASTTLTNATPLAVGPCDWKIFYSAAMACYLCIDCGRLMPTTAVVPQFSRGVGSNSAAAGAEDGQMLCRHLIDDDQFSWTHALMRPELVRHWCPIQLSADARVASQPIAAQENIGYVVGQVLYKQRMPALVVRLFQLASQAQDVRPEELAAMFHAEGVNTRYMGRIASEFEAGGTHGSKEHAPIVRPVLQTLRLEMAVRACAALIMEDLRGAAGSDAARLGAVEQEIVIGHCRQFLLCEPTAGAYWSERLLPQMEAMFGCRCEPLNPVPLADARAAVTDLSTAFAAAAASARTNREPPNVRVSHSIATGSVIAEPIASDLPWRRSSMAPGALQVDVAAARDLLDPTRGNAVLTLLGRGAAENPVALQRLQQLAGLTLQADQRGRLVVILQPELRSLSALVLSPSVAAVLEHAPCRTVAGALAFDRDPPGVCAAVEEAARAEIAGITKIGELDPRNTLPVWLLALALYGRRSSNAASGAAARWFDLRKHVKIPGIAALSALRCAQLLHAIARPERGETMLVEGVLKLRQLLGPDDPLVARWVFQAGLQVVGSLIASETAEPAASDRVQRALEYMDAGLGAAQRHGASPQWMREAIAALALVRYRVRRRCRCQRCRAPATMARRTDADSTVGGAGDRDELLSQRGPGTHVSDQSRTVSTATTQNRAGGRIGRRRQDAEAARNRAAAAEFDETENFVGAKLPPLRDVVLGVSFEAAVGAAPVPNAAVSLESSGDAALLCPPGPPLLGGLAPPSRVVLPYLYLCEGCAHAAASAAGMEYTAAFEPIHSDTAVLLSRAVALLSAPKALRGDGDPTYGDALLAYGIVTGSPATTEAAVRELTRVCGTASAAQVFTAELDLALTLIARSNIIAPFTNASTRDVNRLIEAETVLRGGLQRLMAAIAVPSSPTVLRGFIPRFVDASMQVAGAYSTLAAAKREHALLQHLVDVLAAALPVADQSVSRAAAAMTAYYIRLAAEEPRAALPTGGGAAVAANQPGGQPSTTNPACAALRMAARYSLPWIEGAIARAAAAASQTNPGGVAVADPDAGARVEQALVLLHSAILRPLRRNGSHADRAATFTVFGAVQGLLQAGGPALRSSDGVARAISNIEELTAPAAGPAGGGPSNAAASRRPPALRAGVVAAVDDDVTAAAAQAAMATAQGLEQALLEAHQQLQRHADRTDIYAERLVQKMKRCGERAATMAEQWRRDKVVASRCAEVVRRCETLLNPGVPRPSAVGAGGDAVRASQGASIYEGLPSCSAPVLDAEDEDEDSAASAGILRGPTRTTRLDSAGGGRGSVPPGHVKGAGGILPPLENRFPALAGARPDAQRLRQLYPRVAATLAPATLRR